MTDHDDHEPDGVCCASCAVGAACEVGCPDNPVAGLLGGDDVIAGPNPAVGDLGQDILRGIAAVDQGLGQVWEEIKDVVPYGDVIDKAHDARMRALQQHAPEYYPPTPGPAAPPPPPKPPAPAKGVSLLQIAARKIPRLISSRTITQAVATIRPVDVLRADVQRAKGGDAAAKARFEAMRARAAAGDLTARRQWKAALILAEEPLAAESAGLAGRITPWR